MCILVFVREPPCVIEESPHLGRSTPKVFKSWEWWVEFVVDNYFLADMWVNFRTGFPDEDGLLDM